MTTPATRIIHEAIQEWARAHELPDNAPTVMAEQLAEQAYLDGATVQEAAHRGQSLLRSWSMHPSNVRIPAAV